MHERNQTFARPSHVTFELRQFTNQQIDHILNMSANWRALRAKTVEEYADRMRSGEWDSGNGECLAFASDGRCVNGQHRLSAARLVQGEQREGRLIWFWCAHNVADKSVETMDQGRNRRVVEFLRSDKVANPDEAAGIAASVARMEMAGDEASLFAVVHCTGASPSNGQVLDAYKRHAAAVDYWAAITARFRTSLLPRASLLGMLLFQFAKQNAKAATMFAEKLHDGTGLSRFDPVFMLRETLLAEKNAKRKKDRTEYAALVVKSWVAWMEGREIRTLKFTQVGPTAERFPDHRYGGS